MMSDSPEDYSLIEDYLLWLEPQIFEGHQAYRDLLQTMFAKEFVWFVPHDDNRLADGLDLRGEFCHEQNYPRGTLVGIAPVSFLEVLIGLSRRLAFSAGGQAQEWAWQLMCNLELDRMPNPLSRRKAKQVEDILDTCIHRTYPPAGVGGFFPLARPDEDQTKVELWYQMAAYINELHPER